MNTTEHTNQANPLDGSTGSKWILRCLATAALFLTTAATTIHACPADPNQRRTIKLDDGTEKVVQLIGDEYGHYWKALDNSGCYKERPGKPTHYMKISETDVRRKAAARKRTEGIRKGRDARAPQGYPCTNQDLRGNKSMLVILVSFQDELFSPENAYTYNEVFNATNYSNGDYTGSVKDYFLAQSNNQFELDFDVVGPVTVSRNGAYYGEQTDTKTDAHPAEMVEEAMDLVDSQVDFSRYDWDDDGTVDQVVVIYAGMGQATGGDADDIWGHKAHINSYHDHVFISQYACASEYRMVSKTKRMNSIGTICHEISHCFGLMDTYDLAGVNYGTDRWDIMSIGVHNNNGFTPAGFTAYDKMYCLWQNPVILKEDQQVSGIKPMSEGGDFYLIPNDAWKDEFFLLENRQQTGWDKKLPGHGMLVTHVDYDEVLFYHNIVNTTGMVEGYENDHERMALVLADNDKTVDNRTHDIWQRCLQGDLYPFETNDSLTNTSIPNARLYHKNLDETFLLSKPVTGIKESDNGTMAFTFNNDIGKQSLCHLSDINGEIRVMSGSKAILVTQIHNSGNADFSQKVAAHVYTWEDGNYKIQEPCSIQNISLAADETTTCEFTLENLKDSTDYYAFLSYCKEPDTTTWTPMSEAYPFNLADRNTFKLDIDEDGMTIIKGDKSATFEATFHNGNYRRYENWIALYTYFQEDGEYIIQEPRALAIADMEPFGDQRLTFTLDGLEYDRIYTAFFFYIPDDQINEWEQLGGPSYVVASADANGIDTTTVMRNDKNIYNIFGIKVADSTTRTSNLPPGIYIVNGKKKVVR